MLQDALLLVYCGLVGLATAGAAASLHGMITSRPPGFTLMGQSWLGMFASYLFFAVSGPAIVAAASWRRRVGANSFPLVVGGFAVAWVWCMCSGILVVGLFTSAGRGLV